MDYYGTIKYAMPVKFNIDYLLMHEIRGRALARYLDSESKLIAGGRMVRALALALEHGLIPESVWRPKQTIVLNADQVVNAIDAILGRYQDVDTRERAAHQNEFMAQVDQVFLELLGAPPKRFDFAGKAWTPRELAHDLLGESQARYVQYRHPLFPSSPPVLSQNIISRAGDLIPVNPATIHFKPPIEADASALDHIAKILSTELHPVLLSLATRATNAQHTYRETPEAQGLYQSAMDKQESYKTSHLIYVAGADREANGEINLILQNSHGLADGNQGFRKMLSEFFENHAFAYHDYVPPWFNCNELLQKTH